MEEERKRGRKDNQKMKAYLVMPLLCKITYIILKRLIYFDIIKSVNLRMYIIFGRYLCIHAYILKLQTSAICTVPSATDTADKADLWHEVSLSIF